MPDIDEYAPGTPSWVDVTAPDTDAAAEFYGGLFGWEAGDASEDEAAGGYRMFTLRGRSVAGLSPQREGGPPPMWTTYITVADADATCGAVAEAGGSVFMEAFDVLDAGRMAVIADPQGAVFCIWQPKLHPGSQIVNEPGTLCWNELAVGDISPEPAFYGALFGWTPDTALIGGVQYTTWRLDGSPMGGMVQMDDQWPAGMPAHWLTYFAVADTDATCTRVLELGGIVQVPPKDIEVGRFAVVTDPHGAPFGVMALNPDWPDGAA